MIAALKNNLLTLATFQQSRSNSYTIADRLQIKNISDALIGQAITKLREDAEAIRGTLAGLQDPTKTITRALHGPGR